MLEEIYEEVALKLGLPKSLVKNTYRAYWQFIKASIQKIPLKELYTEEEFKVLKVNFNIPSIGKLYCDYNKYLGKRTKFIIHLKDV